MEVLLIVETGRYNENGFNERQTSIFLFLLNLTVNRVKFHLKTHGILYRGTHI